MLLIKIKRMAMCYLRGHMGIEQNIELGRSLLQQSSNSSDPDTPQSSYVFGLIQLNELPAIAPPDPTLPYSLGIQAIERAAWVGFGPALLRMGLAWQGGEKGYDSCIALRYFHIVSRQQQYLRFKGDLSAGLGGSAEVEISKWMLCGSVDKFPPNEEQAFYFAKLASEQENGLAEFAVGYFYEVGIYVKQDIKSALIWYGLAASHDNKDAADRLKALSINRSNTITKQQHHRTLTQKGRGSIRSFKKKIECPTPMKYYPDLTSNDVTSRSDTPSRFRLSSLFSRNSNISQTPPDIESVTVDDNDLNQAQYQQVYNSNNFNQSVYESTFSSLSPTAERVPSPTRPEQQRYRNERRSLPPNPSVHCDNNQTSNLNSLTQTPNLSYNGASNGYSGRRGFSASIHPTIPINNRPVSPSKGYRRSSSPIICKVPSPVQEHIPSPKPDEGINNFYGSRKPMQFPGTQSFALSSPKPSIHNLPSPEHSPERQNTLYSDPNKSIHSLNAQLPSTPLPSPEKEKDIKLAEVEDPVVPTDNELENSLDQYEENQNKSKTDISKEEDKESVETQSKDNDKDKKINKDKNTPKSESKSNNSLKEEKKKSGFFGYLFGYSAEPASKEKKHETNKSKTETNKKHAKESKSSENPSNNESASENSLATDEKDSNEDKPQEPATENSEKTSSTDKGSSDSSTEIIPSASPRHGFARANTAPILETPAVAGKFRAPSPRKPIHTNSLNSLQSKSVGNIDLTPPILAKNDHINDRHIHSPTPGDKHRSSFGSSSHSSRTSTISSSTSKNSDDTSITTSSYASSMKSDPVFLGSPKIHRDPRNRNVIVVHAIPSGTERSYRTFDEMDIPVAKSKEDCIIM